MSRGRNRKGRGGRVYTNLYASAGPGVAGDLGVSRKMALEAQNESAPVTAEVAGYGNDFMAMPLTNGVVPNPDDIMMTLAPTKLGQYAKLSTDPYLLHRIMRKTDLKYKHLVQTRKNGVLSKEWAVIPNPHDPNQDRAVEIAEFVKASLDGLENFHADLEESLDGIFLGYAVSEIMWEQKSVRYGDGLERLAWIPGALRGRRQGRFGFAEDGSLRYQESVGKFVETPPGKFLVHTHAKENEGMHGTAECTEVFWAWFMKHYFGKWWAIFGEKFGMPTAVATYPQRWDEKQKGKLKAVLKAFQTEFGVMIPEGAKIEFLEAQRVGSVNVYQSFMDWADKGMSEALTGQSLATGQGTGGTGSYAQSQTHNEVKQEFVAADAKELMATLQGQLVRPMVVFNFGEDVPAPQFVIDYEARNLAADLDVDIKLVNDVGLALSVNYFYEKYGRPMPGDGDVVARGKVVAPAFGAGGGGLGDLTQRREDAKEKQPQEKPEEEMPEVEEEEPDEEAPKKKSKALPGREKAQRTHKGITTFAVEADSLDEAKRRRRETDRVLDLLASDGKKAFGRLGDAVLLEAESASDLVDLRERVQGLAATGEYRADLARELVRAKVNGYLIAAAQVQRFVAETLDVDAESLTQRHEGTKKSNSKKSMSADGGGWLNWLAGRRRGNDVEKFSAVDLLADYEPLDPEEALKWFEGLTPLPKAELENLPREAAGSSFTVSDIETRGALGRIQDLISRFLNSGGTTKEFVVEYQATRSEMGLDAAENYRAEALFRTETMRAYGAGRTRSLRDPDVEGAFPLWQYVAIMDDRTREEHAALNGFVAAPDDPVWLSKTPPWDHNCRCDIIPLSRRQIETREIVQKPTVTMPDGSEVDPRGWATGAGFRGIGF